MARHLALVGTTASGKSGLALEVARRRPGVELVSVDSMQVYRGMDIGTAKPSPAERAEIPHHLIDIADVSDRFTVARFATAAADVLAAIEERGHTAILVGGTGLYLQAALGDLSPPGEYPEVRAELEARAGRDGTEALHHRLAELDPVAAGRMEAGNTRRVVRALEVTLGAGVPFSSFGPGVKAFGAADRFSVIGVWLPREVVAGRIARRVEAMVDAGLVDEVRLLAAAGLGRTARQALGYKELLAHVEDGADLGGCVADVVARTRKFARRQRSWFRRDPRIRWHGTEEDPRRLLPGLLAELDAVTRSAG
jgi:tRNA dimethylallyltransferase